MRAEPDRVPASSSPRRPISDCRAAPATADGATARDRGAVRRCLRHDMGMLLRFRARLPSRMDGPSLVFPSRSGPCLDPGRTFGPPRSLRAVLASCLLAPRAARGWRALDECRSGSPVVALSRAPAAATLGNPHSRSTGRTVRCRFITGSLPGPSPFGEVPSPPGLRWTVATAGRNAGGRAEAGASRSARGPLPRAEQAPLFSP